MSLGSVGVALIDNGVVRQLLPACCVVEEVSLVEERNHTLNEGDGRVELHGTLCAKSILSIAPEARLVSIRVAAHSNLVDVQKVVAGIEEAVRCKVQIINISMGLGEGTMAAMASASQSVCGGKWLVGCEDWSGEMVWLDRLTDAVRMAWEGGIIVVAPVHPLGLRTYPADLSWVVSVEAGVFSHSGQFAARTEGERCDFVAYGVQSLEKGDASVLVASGNSFAAAHLSGHIAKLWSQRPDMEPRCVIAELASQAIHDYRLPGPRPPDLREAGPPRIALGPRANLGKVGLFPFDSAMQLLVQAVDLLEGDLVGVVDLPGYGRDGADPGVVAGQTPTGLVIARDVDELPADVETLLVGDIERPSRTLGRNLLASTLRSAASRSWRVKLLRPCPSLMLAMGADQAAMSKRVLDLPANPGIVCQPGGAVWFEDYTVSPVLAVLNAAQERHAAVGEVLLRRALDAWGYRVVHISAHWQFDVLGAACVLHFGLPPLSPSQPTEGQFSYLRHLKVGLCEKQEPDLVLVGAPDPLMAADCRQTSIRWTASQGVLTLMNALRVDAVVLAACPSDSLNLLEEHIRMLEGLTAARVIGLLLADVALTRGMSTAETLYVPAAKGDCQRFCEAATEHLRVPCVRITDPAVHKVLVDMVEGEFGT